MKEVTLNTNKLFLERDLRDQDITIAMITQRIRLDIGIGIANRLGESYNQKVQFSFNLVRAIKGQGALDGLFNFGLAVRINTDSYLSNNMV